MARPAEKAPTIRVWDVFVRFFHWALVACFAAAWLSGDDWKAMHLASGYAASALIAVRIGWGLAPSGYASFRQFVRAPAVTIQFLKDIAAGREARYIGHNPAGGAMIVALLVVLSGVCFTGWLLTTDAFWGTVTMEIIHETLTNIALLLIAFHVGGVVLASIRHRENLIGAMFTGKKRAPEDGDVT